MCIRELLHVLCTFHKTKYRNNNNHKYTVKYKVVFLNCINLFCVCYDMRCYEGAKKHSLARVCTCSDDPLLLATP